MIIYRLLSPSGKSYIGKTKFTIEQRIKGHIHYWKNPKRNRTKLHNAFTKYGLPEISQLCLENRIDDSSVLSSWQSAKWIVQIVCWCVSETELNEKEKEIIKKYDSINNGYNLCRGGEGFTGPQSEYQKQRMREVHTGRIRSPETIEKLKRSLTGNKCPWSGKNGFKKGYIPWNKGMKGIHLSPESEFKKRQQPWNKGTKGLMKAWNKGTLSPSLAARNKQSYTCTTCGQIGRGPGMKRFHFDKCKSAAS